MGLGGGLWFGSDTFKGRGRLVPGRPMREDERPGLWGWDGVVGTHEVGPDKKGFGLRRDYGQLGQLK